MADGLATVQPFDGTDTLRRSKDGPLTHALAVR
jgi:hypothetical protein